MISKTEISLILIIGAALAVCLPASAEVYNCDGLWTSKPCGPSSKPLYNRHGFSGQEESPPPTQPEKPPGTSDGVPIGSNCVEDSHGLDIETVNLTVKRYDNGSLRASVLEGEIVNRSNKPLTTPLAIVVRKGGSAEEENRAIVTKQLDAQQSVSFEILVKETHSGENHSGPYEVYLDYLPRMFCRAQTFDLGSAIPEQIKDKKPAPKNEASPPPKKH